MQEKIYLRPFSLNDIGERYLSWVNDPIVTKYLGWAKQRLKYEDLVRFVNESPKNGRENYAIITELSKNHIGNCSILNVNKKEKTFEMGWLIGEKDFWGGHYSSMVIFNLLKIGFIEMGLKKCIGGVDERNIKARLTNKFSGFEEKEKVLKPSTKENINISTIYLEISKKKWLKKAKALCLEYPEFYSL